MSNLSDFLRRPYPGLSFDSTSFLSTKNVDVRGTSGGASPATLNPTLILRNQDNNLVGNGADLRFHSRDSASADLKIGYVLAKTTAVTAGAVSANLDFMALSAGAERVIRFSGANSALSPAVTGQLSLGTSTLGWLGVRIANAADTLKGELVVDGTGPRLSASGGYPLQLGVSAGTNMRFDADGRIVINDSSAAPTDAQVRIGGTGYHQGAKIGYGLKIDPATPAATSGAGGQYYVANIVPTTSVATESVTGLRVANATGAAVPNNLTGISITAGTGTVSNTGLTINVSNALAANVSIYSQGLAPSYLAGPLSVGGSSTANTVSLEVSRLAGSASALALAYFRDATGVYTGSYIEARTDGTTGFNILNFHNGAGTTYAKMRADGITTLGTATQANTALLTVNGRVSVATNSTYDLLTNTTAESVTITGAASAAGGQFIACYAARPTLTLSSTGVAYGFFADLTLSAAAAGNNSYGIFSRVSAAGTAGISTAIRSEITTSAGHSGSLYGVRCRLVPQGTTAAQTGALLDFDGSSIAATSGVLLTTSAAGNALDVGFQIDGELALSGAAFKYTQRAGATGKFLHYIDSGAADRFVVDSAGDMKFGGVGRRIMADLSDSTHANRLAFQSTTVNSTSILNIIPNGSGTFAGFAAYSTSTHASAIRSMVFATTLSAGLRIEAIGVSEVPAQIQVGGSAVPVCSGYSNGDFTLGEGLTGLTDTGGFSYVPAVAGTQTGVPTARTGFAPILIDTTGHRVGIYSGGAWKWTAALT